MIRTYSSFLRPPVEYDVLTKTPSFIAMFLLLFSMQLSAAQPHKVLVVMSYEQNNPWCEEIKAGIDSVLAESSDITYFYMDTKVDFAAGEAKAAQAEILYRELQPDGVITVDDNAQSMFVLPYLHHKVQTPVMFCGVNAEAEKYGFPSEHVSGTLERGHIRESIAFLKQLKPSFSRVCFVTKDSPSGRSLAQQVDVESKGYLAEVKGFHAVRSVADIRQLSPQLNRDCQAIYIDSLEGIVDDKGRALTHKAVFVALEAAFDGPFIGANRYHVEQGAMSAVVKTGQEQGELAAAMLLKAMQGTPVSELAVTRNHLGRRLINVEAMKKQAIKPRPMLLRGVTLVKTTP